MLAASLSGFAQQQRAAVIMDPSLGTMEVADNAGQMLNAAYINPDQSIRLLVPVSVINHGKQLPAGTCKIKIGLGSKITLDPAYDLNSTTLGNYFRWTAANNSGQVQLTGELIAPLPATVNEANVLLHVKAAALGSSTITANFLITNHHTNSILSDEDGNNNSGFISYTVTRQAAPSPLCTITDMSRNANCNINLLFASNSEVNIVRYDVEASKDGILYTKVAEVAAASLSSYTASFPVTDLLKSASVHVRVKLVQRDGTVFYSASKNVDGNCGGWELNLFPNPAKDIKYVTINAVKGFFKGDYKVTMHDVTGRQMISKEISLNNATSFKLDFGFIAAGKYLIKVISADGTQSAVLKFEKM